MGSVWLHTAPAAHRITHYLSAIMTLVPLVSHFSAASSLLDLARRLGAVCLDHGGWLDDLLADDDAVEMSDLIERKVAALDPEIWESAAESGKMDTILSTDPLGELLEFAKAQHPLEYLAALRGLCHRALPRYYASTEDSLVLDRGIPVWFASRPIQTVFGREAVTPRQATLENGHLLEKLDFRLFEHAAGDRVRVVLDFAWRDRIDDLTWRRSNRLPRIATLHPFLGTGGIEIRARNDSESWFFDVRPANWDLKAVLAQLESVSDVDIAVLPELSLPEAGALDAALASEPKRYPPLVVAGSAHVRSIHPVEAREVRANECRVYLDGQRVCTHYKIHPFELRYIAGEKLAVPLREGLTPGAKTITVLSGYNTRLAVVICADLNDGTIPRLLEEAGVNLLLVPAFTPRVGAFNGKLCSLASSCQAVAVVVNAELDPDPERPFLILAAVPREKPAEQSRMYSHPETEGRVIGVIDPNASLTEAVSWRSCD
jgi:predicted amidohydrolase